MQHRIVAQLDEKTKGFLGCDARIPRLSIQLKTGKMATSQSRYTLGIQFSHLPVLLPAAGDARLLRVAETSACTGADSGELRFLWLVESLVHAANALHYDSGLYLRSLDCP